MNRQLFREKDCPFLFHKFSEKMIHSSLLPWRFRQLGGPLNTLILSPLRRRRLHKEISLLNSQPNDFSVIIGIRNRRDYRLRNALSSIMNQEYPAELIHPIVVDYSSEQPGADEVENICREFGAQFVGVKELAVWNRAHCLNIGIKNSSTKFTITSDGDIIFAPNYLATVRRILEEKPLSFVLSKALDLPEEAGKLLEGHAKTGSPLDIMELKSQGIARFDKCSEGINASYTKFYKELRGYDEFYNVWGFEDEDLIRRFKYLGLSLETLDGESFYLHQWHPKYEGIVDENLENKIQRNRQYFITSHSIFRNKEGWGRTPENLAFDLVKSHC